MNAATIEARHVWKIPGMPHRGWWLGNVEDLEEPTHTCEACGKTEIRYVHTIHHRDWDSLDVGCVCCEHLTGDYVNPRAREAELRNAAARRKAQARRDEERRASREAWRQSIRESWPWMTWQRSAKGNLWLKIAGILITVFAARGGYRFVGRDHFSKTYADEDDACEASLELFEYLHRLEG